VEYQSKKKKDNILHSQLIELSPVAIFIQLNNHILFTNPAAVRLFGVKNPEQLNGRSVIDFVPHSNRELIKKQFNQMREDGIAIPPFEEKLIRFDGSEIDVEVMATPFLYQGKSAELITFYEISKRKRFEKLLFQSKHDWQDTFNNITDMITIHDKDFNIIFANKSAEKILRLPYFEEGKKVKCFRHYHGTESPPNGCPSCACLTTAKPASFELFEPHLNIYIEIRAMPRFDSDNQLIGLIHIARDITERNQMEAEIQKAKDELEVKVKERTRQLSRINEQLSNEIIERKKTGEALQKSESKYRNLSEEFNALLDAIADNIVLLSPELKIVWVNKTAASMFGKKNFELTGQYCYDLCCGISSPCGNCPAIKSLSTGREESVQILSPTGKILDVRAFPIKDATGSIRNVIEVTREITEAVKLQAETTRVKHLASLGELAAGVAHEITNPINNIINYAQILVDEYERENQDHDIAQRIIRDGGRIATIVRSLLSFARVRKEGKGIVSLNEIFSEMLALTEMQLRKECISLRMNIPSALPEIFANPQEIQQVFLNIVSNSRFALNTKYPLNDKDKIFEIRCEEITFNSAPFIQITFYDTGVGIAPHMLDKALNPFFSTKPHGLGTGLGLSISHRIITDHGGKLTIESEEGRFTKVTIILPAAAQAGEGNCKLECKLTNMEGHGSEDSAN